MLTRQCNFCTSFWQREWNIYSTIVVSVTEVSDLLTIQPKVWCHKLSILTNSEERCNTKAYFFQFFKGNFIFLVHCIYYNWQILTLVRGNRKEKGRVCVQHSIPCSLEKAKRPATIDLQQFLAKEAKSVPGFQPSLLRQNATALPLEPQPWPVSLLSGSSSQWAFHKN